MLRLLESFETWKRRFLQDVSTDEPAAPHVPGGHFNTSASSIPRAPSAPPIICTPLSPPILPAQAGGLAVESVNRSRSTPPSVDNPTKVSALGTPILLDESHDDNGLSTSSTQAINMQNFGSHNQLHVGDDNRLIVTGNVEFYARGASFISSLPHLVNAAPEPPTSRSIKFSLTSVAITYIIATQGFLGALFGRAINDSEGKLANDSFSSLVESITSILTVDDSSAPQAVRDYLRDIWSELCQARERLYNADNNSVDVEACSLHIAWTLRLFLFVSHMGGYIRPSIVVEGVKKRMVEMRRDAEAPRKFMKYLPRARVAYDDYVSGQGRFSCFEGTRQALLEEVGRWVAKSEAGIFVLFGLAGIGKSTIAQTIAERADDVRLLGASFFFSRSQADHRTAENFFVTIAFQLCVHDPEFASAIESVLIEEQGTDVFSKHPLEQLEVLILEPLRKLTPRKVVVVVDALDECRSEDIPVILVGLNKLVQALPSFKVFLTTRPQQHLQLQASQSSQKVFYLHNIEDQIVDHDIELYLRHKLSFQEVKVRVPNLKTPWAASDDEIKSLARAAGQRFIIASTAVLFILDKTRNPTHQMKVLRTMLDQHPTPSDMLNNFYPIILRNAVPQRCEYNTVDRYQAVIGAIILIQRPLSIPALATLTNIGVDDIVAVLENLQPVIFVGSNNIPVVCHKSFLDYIKDSMCCTDEDLHIDPRLHHTQMATNCLRLLNRYLKQNIFDLTDSAQFMDNYQALEKQGLTENQISEKIPSELQYACSYLANHIQNADEDPDLEEELEQFINERLLNWLEALSWIQNLDSAHHTLLTVQNRLRLTSPNLLRLVADGLRFIGKFNDLIRQSALHVYHSALPLTPTETSLYMRYSKQMTFCRVQGGQKKWDSLVASFSGNHFTNHVTFSQNGAMLACFMRKGGGDGSLMIIHDAVTGKPLGRIEGRVLAIAADFSKATASGDDDSITLYNVKSITPVASIKLSAAAIKLVLSPDGSRLVSGLNDGAVCLWDTEKCKQIGRFSGWKEGADVAFSADGSRVAIAISNKGSVTLLNATSGETITDLSCYGIIWSKLVFSRDGSRPARLVAKILGTHLTIWNGLDGTLIREADGVWGTMAISTDGSRIAGGNERRLRLWRGNDLTLLKTLDLDFWIESLEFHNDLLGIASYQNDVVVLYDMNSHECIGRLPFKKPAGLAFSPDCTRLASWNAFGEARLWDVLSITTSDLTPQEKSSTPTELAFSPDCARLASCHEDGTIKLWDTSHMAQVAVHEGHSEVRVLAFSVDGREFASAARNTIRLWNGNDGAQAWGDILECSGNVNAVALSSHTLAAATEDCVTLWNLETHAVITTIKQRRASILAFSHHNSLLATYTKNVLTVRDVVNDTLVTTFKHVARRMRFLPENSQLAVQDRYEGFLLVDCDGRRSEASENQAISRLGLCPTWHGIPVWIHDGGVVGRFPERAKVLKCPSDLRVKTTAEGSSMIALGCEDGRIRLITAS